MSRIKFSLNDYRDGFAEGYFLPPDILCPYYEIDPTLYKAFNSRDWRLKMSFNELRKRVGKEYFSEIYPLQARTLDYSTRAFPSYRFILPEVLTYDWLSIVNWEKPGRDHVLHQPLCGYIVLKLLDDSRESGGLLLPNNKTILQTCVNNILQWKETAYIREFLLDCGMDKNDPILDINNKISHICWRIFLREAAFTAAVFHDLGYPWRYAETIQRNLEGINTPAVKQNQGAEQIVDLFGSRLLYSPFNGYQTIDATCPSTWKNKLVNLTSLSLSKTHGFPGALGFLHLNDCIRRYPYKMRSPMHSLCVEWAAVAIMMHDMREIYWGENKSTADIPENSFLRLDFNRDPLSSIVTLVDVIQEFGRPAVTYEDAEKFQVNLKYEKPCSDTELEVENGVMTLRYKIENDEKRALKLKYISSDKYKYFDNQNGFLNLESLGINDVMLVVN